MTLRAFHPSIGSFDNNRTFQLRASNLFFFLFSYPVYFAKSRSQLPDEDEDGLVLCEWDDGTDLVGRALVLVGAAFGTRRTRHYEAGKRK
jgi:hypothetical protein